MKLIALSFASRVKYYAGRNYTLIEDVLVRAEKETVTMWRFIPPPKTCAASYKMAKLGDVTLQDVQGRT